MHGKEDLIGKNIVCRFKRMMGVAVAAMLLWTVGPHLIVGASLILHRFKISYAQVSRSKEFKKQDTESSFGSISFSYSF